MFGRSSDDIFLVMVVPGEAGLVTQRFLLNDHVTGHKRSTQIAIYRTVSTW